MTNTIVDKIRIELQKEGYKVNTTPQEKLTFNDEIVVLVTNVDVDVESFNSYIVTYEICIFVDLLDYKDVFTVIPDIIRILNPFTISTSFRITGSVKDIDFGEYFVGLSAEYKEVINL